MGSNAIRLAGRPSTSTGTMRCGATRATPGITLSLSARSDGRVASVGCTVSRLAVMLTKVLCGTTRRSAPIRARLAAIPFDNAQPVTNQANPTPTPSMTAAASRIARSRRRPTFCAASRSSSQRSRGPLAMPSDSSRQFTALVDRGSESDGPRVLHMFEFGRDDHTVVVPAIARPDPDQLVSAGIDEGDAAFQTLETAEHADHVFSVIGDRQGLHVRPDPLDLLLDRPGVGVDHHDPAARWRRMQDRQIELRTVHRKHHVERVRVLAAPQRVFDMRNFFPVARIGSLESKTEQLFSRRLFIMTQNRPSGENPTSWPGEKILSNFTSQ